MSPSERRRAPLSATLREDLISEFRLNRMDDGSYRLLLDEFEEKVRSEERARLEPLASKALDERSETAARLRSMTESIRFAERQYLGRFPSSEPFSAAQYRELGIQALTLLRSALASAEGE